MEGHCGPYFYTEGTLTANEKDTIFEATGVSASIRGRAQWGNKRGLSLSGPVKGLEKAKEMADEMIVASVRAKTKEPVAEPSECATRDKRLEFTSRTQKWVQSVDQGGEPSSKATSGSNTGRSSSLERAIIRGAAAAEQAAAAARAAAAATQADRHWQAASSASSSAFGWSQQQTWCQQQQLAWDWSQAQQQHQQVLLQQQQQRMHLEHQQQAWCQHQQQQQREQQQKEQQQKEQCQPQQQQLPKQQGKAEVEQPVAPKPEHDPSGRDPKSNESNAQAKPDELPLTRVPAAEESPDYGSPEHSPSSVSQQPQHRQMVTSSSDGSPPGRKPPPGAAPASSSNCSTSSPAPKKMPSIAAASDQAPSKERCRLVAAKKQRTADGRVYHFGSIGRKQSHEDSLQRLQSDHGLNAKQVVLVNVEDFENVAGGGKNHTGMHEDMWLRMAKNERALLKVCRELKRQLDDISEDRMDIWIVFECAWGKHRSVAMAEMLENIVHSRYLYKTTLPTHYDKSKWSRSKCGWKECWCHAMSKKKENALDLVDTAFFSIFKWLA